MEKKTVEVLLYLPPDSQVDPDCMRELLSGHTINGVSRPIALVSFVNHTVSLYTYAIPISGRYNAP